MKETNKKLTCAECGRVITISAATLINQGFEDERYLGMSPILCKLQNDSII